MSRPADEVAAELRRVAFKLEELDDGAALPPLLGIVNIQVTSHAVPSEDVRMSVVDRVAGALGMVASLSAPQFAQYRATSAAAVVYTSAPLASAAQTIAVGAPTQATP